MSAHHFPDDNPSHIQGVSAEIFSPICEVILFFDVGSPPDTSFSPSFLASIPHRMTLRIRISSRAEFSRDEVEVKISSSTGASPNRDHDGDPVTVRLVIARNSRAVRVSTSRSREGEMSSKTTEESGGTKTRRRVIVPGHAVCTRVLRRRAPRQRRLSSVKRVRAVGLDMRT